MNWDEVYAAFRTTHILIGIVGVVAFWIPVGARKGSPLHIRAGRIFEWCGYYVASTALFACARYLLTPHHFAFIDRPGESAEEIGPSAVCPVLPHAPRIPGFELSIAAPHGSSGGANAFRFRTCIPQLGSELLAI